MQELLIKLRLLQIFAQQSHNLIQSETFFGDHCFLEEVYKQTSSDYDSVAERTIGTLGDRPLHMHEILESVSKRAALLPPLASAPDVIFKALKVMEVDLCEFIEEAVRDEEVSEGTKQLIGEIANKSEMRQYKLNRRLGV